MLIKFNIIKDTKKKKLYFLFFILVNNQKNIENQLGIRVTDSGIGNPRRVRDRKINKQICKCKSRLDGE
jgi:hypothetical protein